ncbi:MAG: hypothetical protein JJU02_06210 [Cryomorphaceae bacterium]|nr:hypothetical protein [Cryomorphaceae bacterium]
MIEIILFGVDAKLIMLTMISFVWCYKVGGHIDQKLKQIKIKKHGRKAISIIKYGLETIARCLLSINYK